MTSSLETSETMKSLNRSHSLFPAPVAELLPPKESPTSNRSPPSPPPIFDDIFLGVNGSAFSAPNSTAFDRNFEDNGVAVASLIACSSFFSFLLALVVFFPANTKGETPGVIPTGDDTSKHPGASTYGGFTFMNETK